MDLAGQGSLAPPTQTLAESGSFWGGVCQHPASPVPPRAGMNDQGRIPGKRRSCSCGWLVLHSSSVHRCPVSVPRNQRGGSSTFGCALFGVALAVAPGEMDQHPLPLLRLSHQRERFQERPAKRKGYSEMHCWAVALLRREMERGHLSSPHTPVSLQRGSKGICGAVQGNVLPAGI